MRARRRLPRPRRGSGRRSRLISLVAATAVLATSGTSADPLVDGSTVSPAPAHQPAVSVSGSVTQYGGPATATPAPVRGGTVTFRTADGGTAARTALSSDGRFAVELVEGDYLASVSSATRPQACPADQAVAVVEGRELPLECHVP